MDPYPVDRPPRVLIEALEWVVGEATAAAFRSAGWDVVTCTGPVGLAQRCPHLDGGVCSTVAWADVVVSRLSLHDVRNRELLGRLVADGEMPVVLETPPATFACHRDELEGCTVVPYPARLSDLVATAEARLSGRAAEARVRGGASGVLHPGGGRRQR